MGHKQTGEQGLNELIELAKTTTRELREAIADSKQARRELDEAMQKARREIAVLGRGVIQEILVEVGVQEHDRLRVEIDKAITASHRMIERKALDFWHTLTQIDKRDSLTVGEVMIAQATLDRFIALGDLVEGDFHNRHDPLRPKGGNDG